MFTEAVQGLLRDYKAYAAIKQPPETAARVHVDEIAAKFAKAYEQVRNVIDYREEHLLRQRSILRALQRGVLLHGGKSEMALRLIREMIRSGHFSNDRIPEEKVAHVQRLIDNLLLLLELVRRGTAGKNRELSMWLMVITASAVEECIDPPWKDRAASAAMFACMKDQLVITGEHVSDHEKDVQLFIAIQRALLRVDADQLSYRLLTFLYPRWESFSRSELEGFAGDLLATKRLLDLAMAHPLGSYFFKLCNQYNTVFLLLGDAAFGTKSAPDVVEAVFADEPALFSAVREAYQKRYTQQRQRLRRLAFFSVISLFISKVIVALAIEIPIDTYLTNSFSLENTIINLLFPPFLMVIIIGFIRMPTAANIELVLAEVRAAVYRHAEKKYLLAIPERKKPFVQTMVRLFFIVVSLLVLFGVWTVLGRLHFSIASATVFVLFTSIVAATGIRVHNRARDISLEPSRASLRTFAWDIIIMPFVNIGQVTIAGLSKFKILVLLFDLIDAPFQVFVLFIENFNIFLRNKKEELY